MRRVICLLAAVALFAGCQTTPPPDPNDPAEVGMMEPDVLMKNLKWASDAANLRVANGEIDEVRAKELVAGYAEDLIEHIDVQRIEPAQAGEYAEVFRTAREWKKARALFEVALEKPHGEDRRINDSLRLAQVLGYLGEVGEAIRRARSTFDAAPKDRAPLMPALTLEIVPACRDKGKDAQLADLLEEAMPLYDATTVDRSTEAGLAFVMAKPYHMRRAATLIRELRESK